MLKYFAVITLVLGNVLANSQSCDLDFEDFETNGTTPPTGWQRINSYLTSVGTPYSGTYNAGFNTEDDILIVEPLDCPKQICFYWRTSGTTSSFDVDIDWSDDNELTWNTVHTLRVQDTLNRTTYRQTCVDLPLNTFNPTTGVKIRFRQYNRTTGSWYLDDICLSSGGATQLSFSSIPSGCNLINKPLTTTVCATDACRNIDNSFTGNITISKNSGTGNLSGTTTLTASSGCATFSNLEFDSESNYTLLASDGSLADEISSSIEIKSNCPTVDSLTIVTYNLLNFPNGRNDCGVGNVQPVNRVDTLKKIMNYIQPDILMVCELQDAAGADLILSNALNVDGETKYAKANFVLNSSSGATGLYNMFYYNSDKVVLKSQDIVLTDLRDVNEYIIYCKDPNLSTHKDTTYIDLYEAHLKAGSSVSDESRREIEVDSIRKFIDLKPGGRNNIIGGDFNFYTNTETAYQTLCYSGTYPFNDPISREGSWNNNFSFADVHSQSTRLSAQIECGASGGTDDRFDFLLTSSNILSGLNRVKYIPNTYTALGNNGSVFNGNINDVGNTSLVPDSILNALFYMSDHLPVIMKLEIQYPQINLSLKEKEIENLSLKSKINWNIYPNPSTEYLIVEREEYNYKNEIILHSIWGRELITVDFNENETLKEIDISILESGIYFISIKKNNIVIETKKIIIK